MKLTSDGYHTSEIKKKKKIEIKSKNAFAYISLLYKGKGYTETFVDHISFLAQHQIFKEAMGCIHISHFRHLKVLELR